MEVSKASDPFADHFQLPRLYVGDDRQKLFLCGLLVPKKADSELAALLAGALAAGSPMAVRLFDRLVNAGRMAIAFLSSRHCSYLLHV